MPKKFIKRYIPDHHTVREHRFLKLFGALLHDPNLWHINRRSTSGAFGVGLFCAFVPVPFQMVLAAALAIPLRVNLPVSVALVWLTNPFTMPPIFYTCYKLGAWLLNTPPKPWRFELSFGWLLNEMGSLWQPFLLGCFLMATMSGITGYLVIRGLWRLHVVRHHQGKKMARFHREQKGKGE